MYNSLHLFMSIGCFGVLIVLGAFLLFMHHNIEV